MHFSKAAFILTELQRLIILPIYINKSLHEENYCSTLLQMTLDW